MGRDFKFVASCVFLVASAATFAQNLGKLHCIGDSLTFGAGGSPGTGGYRHGLSDDLAAKGYSFQMVGSCVTWPGGSWLQGFHDGHGGWTTMELVTGRPGASGIADWLTTWQSDTIVLNSGRNDPYDWSYSHAWFSLLLETIYETRPNAVVYWSNVFLPEDQSVQEQTRCQIQNSAIRLVVAEQCLLGRRVWYIDAYQRLKGVAGIYSDSVHLNDKGYEIWEKLILQTILKTPVSNGNRSAVPPF